MDLNFGLRLPLACPLLYVIAAMAEKRAAVFGVGVWCTSSLSN